MGNRPCSGSGPRRLTALERYYMRFATGHAQMKLSYPTAVMQPSRSELLVKAIDLFCGCGGISAGLRSAGFDVIAGVDIEPKYISSFTHNFPTAKPLLLDISEVTPKKFMADLGIRRGEVELLAGGPPCQGFSKNVPRRHRYLDDSRNQLIKSFLDYCEAIQPRMILMENVAEMKNGFDQAYSEEVQERLESCGYVVSHDVLNAADYGVPQRRRRAFFIANKDGVEFTFPEASHGSPVEAGGQRSLLDVKAHVTVWDAIGDLPPVKHGQAAENVPYVTEPRNEFQRKLREGAKLIRNHSARELRPLQFQRLASLEPGQTMKHLPDNLKTKGGYSGAYGRLTKDMIAPTITRWVFHPGSGRWGHPVDTRVLTIREVARIQGFPDSFEFVGTYNQQAGQLGNAVPPLLAEALATAMVRQLRSTVRVASRSLRR